MKIVFQKLVGGFFPQQMDPEERLMVGAGSGASRLLRSCLYSSGLLKHTLPSHYHDYFNPLNPSRLEPITAEAVHLLVSNR